jgi:hypothetical protein
MLPTRHFYCCDLKGFRSIGKIIITHQSGIRPDFAPFLQSIFRKILRKIGAHVCSAGSELGFSAKVDEVLRWVVNPHLTYHTV